MERGPPAKHATRVNVVAVDRTPFPVTPADVVPLSVQECAFDVEIHDPPLTEICNRFMHDSNRALVWALRFKALQAWCARKEIKEWLRHGPDHSRGACEVAASFGLNGDWEFDTQAFRSAVESANSHRPRISADA